MVLLTALSCLAHVFAAIVVVKSLCVYNYDIGELLLFPFSKEKQIIQISSSDVLATRGAERLELCSLLQCLILAACWA